MLLRAADAAGSKLYLVGTGSVPLFWFDDFAYGKGQFDRLLEIISQLQNTSAAQLEDAH
jgi:hypothetical protein